VSLALGTGKEKDSCLKVANIKYKKVSGAMKGKKIRETPGRLQHPPAFVEKMHRNRRGGVQKEAASL